MLQGDEIVIEVEDDGCGIPPKKSRAFSVGVPRTTIPALVAPSGLSPFR
jgi:sensor histidine kinase regulating citrate/malate metabolism